MRQSPTRSSAGGSPRLALRHGAGFVRGVFLVVVSALICKTGYDAFLRWRRAGPRFDNAAMDDIVRQALAKWPNVPDCFGWLGLDARGQWYMRDDRTQAAGPFPQARGSLLRHDKLVEFIHRNYEKDGRGCWFFQNGPQRVYVELEVAPLVLRVGADGGVTAHTGQPLPAGAALTDEHGRLFVLTPQGLGLVHTLDMHLAADLVEQGRWTPEAVAAADLPARFGHVLSPAAEKKAGR